MAQLELDRVLQSLTQDFQKFRTTFTQVTTGAQKTLVQAEATVKNIVSSAGGAAWNTFTGSIQIVGMQLSRFFVPTLIMASKGLQDLANWLDELSPENRKMAGEFAGIAAAAALTTGAMRLLGFSVGPLTIGFGLLLIAVQALTKWIDGWIEARHKATAEAAGKQFTNAEVEASPEYTGIMKLGDKEKQRKYISERLKELQKNLIDLGGVDPFGAALVPEHAQVMQETFKKIGLYEAIQRKLAGETLPNSVAPYSPPGLGGGFGIGGLAGILGLGSGGGGVGGGAGGGGGRGNRFKFAWPTEMQPHFSSIEEARKQFQLSALKNPLEQELMRLQRQQAQEAIQEAGKRNRAWDVLGNLGNILGFR